MDGTSTVTGMDWQDFLSDPVVAPNISRMIHGSDAWIHRRVERVEFNDDQMLTRHLSMDFTVPSFVPRLPWQGMHCLVPLTMLRKEPLTNFDLHDETKRSVPILTAAQNGALSLGILLSLAGSVLDRAVEGRTREALQALVNVPANDADDDAWDAFTDVLIGGTDAALAEHVDFLALTEGFFERFLLVAVLEAQAGDRRILKLGYDSPFELDDGGTLRSRFAARSGLRPAVVSFAVESLMPPMSTHVEVVKPTDIEILRVDAQVSAPTRSASTAGPRRHLHLGELVAGEATVGRVHVLPEATGWMEASRWVPWVVFLMITAVMLRLDGLQKIDQGAGPASLTLAVTAFVAGLLSRPPAHALATRLVSIRAGLVWVPTLTGLYAAAFNGLAFDPGVVRWAVWPAAGVCGLAAFILSWRAADIGD